MTALYDTRLVIAALRNVPCQGGVVAFKNGGRIFAEHPDILVVTETWDAAVKRGLRNAAPDSFRWFTARGQSVMVGWDSKKYRLKWKKRIKGGASPKIRRVTDRRDLFIVCLEDIKTGRCVVVVGVHTSPLPTKKAPELVPVATRSHAHAADNVEETADMTGYPVIAAGDFNTNELVPVSDLRIGPGIVHAECFNGDNAEFGKHSARVRPLRSDHPLVVIELELVAA